MFRSLLWPRDVLSKGLTKCNNSRILRMNSAPKSATRLLLCSRDGDALLATQGEVFRTSGYNVVATASKEQIQKHIENTDFDVVVLNHTLSFSDRKAIARKAKQRNPNNGVLVLHHSGSLGNPYVDLAVDSRGGVKSVLDTLKRMEAMRHARSHHSPAADGDYVVVADLNRNYTFATDTVCELLGYDRAMLLELRIDDIVDGSTHMTASLFQKFVAQGAQIGRITLRHRSGRKIQVNYSAVAEPDGCVIAHWEPLETSAAG
jgi:PAS domain-containing protein